MKKTSKIKGSVIIKGVKFNFTGKRISPDQISISSSSFKKSL